MSRARLALYLDGLVWAAVSGGSGAVATALALPMVPGAPAMTFSLAWHLFLSHAAIGALMYLKKSPRERFNEQTQTKDSDEHAAPEQ